MKNKQSAYHMLLVLLLFSIIFIRAPKVLLLPSLRAEDGSKVFAHFYQNRELGQLLRFRNAYIPLLANVIGFVSVRFPIRMTPYVLTWAPLLITLAVYSTFFHKRYAQYVPSDRLRFAVCVLFALAPNGQFHLFALTDYSIWNTFLFLILLSLLQFPDRHRIPFLLLYCALIWSHPLTILTLPASIYSLIKDRTNRVYYAIIIVNHLFHQVLGIATPQNVLDRSLVDLAQAVFSSLGYLVDVLFVTFFGRAVFESVSQSAQYLVYLWAIVFLSMIVTLCGVNKSFRKLCLSLGYYVVSIIVMVFLVRGADVVGPIRGSQRYFYIPSLLLIVMMTTGLVHILTWTISKASARLNVKGVFPALAEGVVIGLLVVHYFILNFGNLASYRHNPENGYIVRDFFRDLAEEERRLGSHEGIYLRADKIDDWSIVIDTRENKPPPLTGTKVVYHDGYYHDEAGRYEEGVFPWMDLLAELGGKWCGPERAPLDDIDAQPLPDGVHWECEGGFVCHPNGEAWWTESSTEGIARLIGPSGEVMAEVPLAVVFRGSGDG
jgi:hypothetical protein